MKWLVEHRMLVQRQGRPKFVELEQLHHHVGFRGVYAFSEQHVEDIIREGHTRNLSSLPCYSRTLLCDFDHNPLAAHSFKVKLRKLGVAYAEFDSGNRSVHFHVAIVPMLGQLVPQYQRYWVRSNAPGADISFYHSGGVYRLPGTYHVKNPGHCKALVEFHDGERLAIPEYCPPSQIYAPGGVDEEVDLAKILVRLCAKEATEGDRTPHMFKILRTAQRIGYSFDEVVEELLAWNSDKCFPPHPDDHLLKWIHRTWHSSSGLSGLAS